MKVTRVLALILLVAGLSTGPLGQREATGDELYEYGEYLSNECTTCHQLHGYAEGVPSITNWPMAVFIVTLKAYRDGTEENQAMRSVAKRLTDEDIEALAVFFNKQDP